MKNLVLSLMVFSLGSIVHANEDLMRSLSKYPPQQEIFCLPSKILNAQIKYEIDFITHIGEIDKNRCMDLSDDPSGRKLHIYRTILDETSTLEIAAKDFGHNNYAVVYTPSSGDNEFLKTSSVVLGSIMIGNLAADRFYEDQSDKYYHSRAGGLISGTTTAGALIAAYFIPDSRLNPKLKKLLIGCSGFIVSTLAGVVKETLDSRDPSSHSVDKHDL